jgi:hypothetical protein
VKRDTEFFDFGKLCRERAAQFHYRLCGIGMTRTWSECEARLAVADVFRVSQQ